MTAKPIDAEEFRGLVGTRLALRSDWILIAVGSRMFATLAEASSVLALGPIDGRIVIRAHEVRFTDRSGSAWVHIACVPRAGSPNWQQKIASLGYVVKGEQDIVVAVEGGADYLENCALHYLEWIRTGKAHDA